MSIIPSVPTVVLTTNDRIVLTNGKPGARVVFDAVQDGLHHYIRIVEPVQCVVKVTRSVSRTKPKYVMWPDAKTKVGREQ